MWIELEGYILGHSADLVASLLLPFWQIGRYICLDKHVYKVWDGRYYGGPG